MRGWRLERTKQSGVWIKSNRHEFCRKAKCGQGSFSRSANEDASAASPTASWPLQEMSCVHLTKIANRSTSQVQWPMSQGGKWVTGSPFYLAPSCCLEALFNSICTYQVCLAQPRSNLWHTAFPQTCIISIHCSLLTPLGVPAAST